MAGPLERLRAIVDGAAAPPPALEHYVAKVRACAYAVTDRDIEELEAAGVREDEIFEQTVVAAVGEGLRRLDAAARAIG